MRIIDKVAWLYVRSGRVLSTRSKGKTVWYLPGGKRENGESDLETLIREVSEELSVSLDVSTITFCGSYEAQADGHAEGVLVRMRCYFAVPRGPIQISAEIEEMAWFTYEDRGRSSAVDRIVFDDLLARGLLVLSEAEPVDAANG